MRAACVVRLLSPLLPLANCDNPPPGAYLHRPPQADTSATTSSARHSTTNELVVLKSVPTSPRLTSEQLTAAAMHIHACLSRDAELRLPDRQAGLVVQIIINQHGVVCQASVVAAASASGTNDPAFQSFEQHVVRAILDPRCAALPLPSAALGPLNVLRLRFGSCQLNQCDSK